MNKNAISILHVALSDKLHGCVSIIFNIRMNRGKIIYTLVLCYEWVFRQKLGDTNQQLLIPYCLNIARIGYGVSLFHPWNYGIYGAGIIKAYNVYHLLRRQCMYSLNKSNNKIS